MVEINLREYYPDFYTADVVIEVSDELAAQFRRWRLNETAYRLRTYRHRAKYSLDRGDGIEYDAVFVSLSHCEIYERRVTTEQLYATIAKLPDKQAKRRAGVSILKTLALSLYRTGKINTLPHIVILNYNERMDFMKQKALQIHRVFPTTGDDVRQLVQQSFSLYLCRILAKNGSHTVS